MFKPGRWRGDKNRVTALFKLQFHATQVSEIGADSLVVSVIPVDAVKPPVRSHKARIRDGWCRWEDPIYESVMFNRDLKTGRTNQKVYRFVVSVASVRTGSIGEASMDFADYVEATKATSVTFPLKNSNSNAVLHITIQRMEENRDQSAVEANEDNNVKFVDRNPMAQPSTVEEQESIRNNFTENEKSSSSDLTSSTTSESSSLGINTPRDLGARHGNIEQQDPASFLSLLGYVSFPKSPISNPKSCEDNGRSQREWSFDRKLKADDTGERPDSDIKRLRAELSAMARKMEVSEMELQTMRRQIAKENRRGQELAKENDGLREERDSLKEENRALRAFKARFEESKVKSSPTEDGRDLQSILEEVRQEVNYEKDLNMNLRLQLEKTQESNEELLLAVRDLDEMLEEKNQEITELSSGLELPEIGKVDTDEEDQQVLEELVRGHKASKVSDHQMKNLAEVYKEFEACRREKDELEMQMEQLALDYEILKQENHEISKTLEQSELKEQLKVHCECSPGFELETRLEVLERDLEEKSEELLESVAKIDELVIHVKNLEGQLVSKEKEFEANLEEITNDRIEQEKRAIKAEEALKKMQLRNVNTAERLQEEFRRLSTQMATMFDENEKATTRAMNEASDLRRDKACVEELLVKAREDIQSLRKAYEEKVTKLSGDIEAKQNLVESLRGEILRLKEHNDRLSEQVKHDENLMEQLGRLEDEALEKNSVVRRANADRIKLLETVTLLKDEMKEKEEMIRGLESQLSTVKTKLTNLQASVLEQESENEQLRKKVAQFKTDPQKKEDTIARGERRSISTGRAAVSNGMKSSQRNTRPAAPVNPGLPGSKEIYSMKEKIKFLEEKIASKEAELEASMSPYLEKEREMQNKFKELQRRLTEQNQIISCMSRSDTEETENPMHSAAGETEALVAESEMLKERNTTMAMELKDLQERYSKMSVKFAEVEGERQQLVMAKRSKNPRSWFSP